MKHRRLIFPFFLLLIIFTLTSGTLKKGSEKHVYAFGIATSFSDSVIYYTEIQVLDSVVLGKNDQLPGRAFYSQQLKNHLQYQKNLPNRTCMIYFSSSKNKLSKEFTKITSRYKKDKNNQLIAISPEEFKFIKPED